MCLVANKKISKIKNHVILFFQLFLFLFYSICHLFLIIREIRLLIPSQGVFLSNYVNVLLLLLLCRHCVEVIESEPRREREREEKCRSRKARPRGAAASTT